MSNPDADSWIKTAQRAAARSLALLLAVLPGGIASLALAQSVQPPSDAEGPEMRPPTVTWEAAVREAVMSHPAVVESVARLYAQGEEVEFAKAGYRPQITAGLGSGYNSLAPNRWYPRANISASQMLYDFGKVSGAVASAEAGVKISRADIFIAVDQLIRDTSHAIIEIRRDTELIEVAQDQMASVRSIDTLVNHRYRLGAATKSDALQALARLQGAEVTVQQVEADRKRWESNLAFLTGRTTPPAIEFAVPAPLLGACARGVDDWSLVPAVMQADAKRERARADLARSKAEGMPTLSLGAGAGTDIHDPLSHRADYNIGFSVTSALYQGGATKARTRSAIHVLSAADAEEARVRLEVSRLVAEAAQQEASLVTAANTLDARQASMAQTGRLYRLQYLDMGTRTLVDLLNAEQELHQVRFALVNARYDILRLQLDCLYYSGAQRSSFGLSGTKVQGVML